MFHCAFIYYDNVEFGQFGGVVEKAGFGSQHQTGVIGSGYTIPITALLAVPTHWNILRLACGAQISFPVRLRKERTIRAYIPGWRMALLSCGLALFQSAAFE